MVVRIGGLPVWVGPTEVVAGMRGVLGWTDEAIGVVAGLPERVTRLLDVIEGLAARVEPLLLTVEAVAGAAAAVVEHADGVATRADALVTRAELVASGAGALLDTYQPIAAQAAPLARRFVQEFSEDELVAAIRLVDQLPRLTEHMESDIMPLLATLDRVGPDVHELLEQLSEVRQTLQSILNFRLFRRRGEEVDESRD